MRDFALPYLPGSAVCHTRVAEDPVLGNDARFSGLVVDPAR